jgi:hypothetical protein
MYYDKAKLLKGLTLQNLPDVNLHFHSAATRYQGGDILVMIEQSLPMVNAFGFMGEVFDNAVASARHLRTINPHTRAVFYGSDNGLHDIDLDAPQMASNLPTASKPNIPATMRALSEQYPFANPCRPLHVLMLSAGGLGGSYSEAMTSMLDVMQKPGAQVMIDLLLIPNGPKLFQQMAGVAASKMLEGGAEIDALKPAPNFYMVRTAEDIPREIGNAINKRISPDNPKQFMLDLVCSIVGRGTCTPVSCPTTASFAKQRKP